MRSADLVAMMKQLGDELADVRRALADLAARTATQPGIDLPTGLTRRQHEVARLAAHGWSNAEIADALGVSVNTVKKHLKDLFVRLDVTNRAELAARLIRADDP